MPIAKEIYVKRYITLRHVTLRYRYREGQKKKKIKKKKRVYLLHPIALIDNSRGEIIYIVRKYKDYRRSQAQEKSFD